MNDQPGNITKALQAIAKFEELARAGMIRIVVEEKKFFVRAKYLPVEESTRNYWLKEAFLYFKFNAVGDFDEENDALTFIDIATNEVIDIRTKDQLEEVASNSG